MKKISSVMAVAVLLLVAAFYFNTSAVAGTAASITSPSNNATNVAHPSDVEWSAVVGASSYQLEVATSSDFKSPMLYNQSGITALKVTGIGTSASTTYFARVKADNEGSFGSVIQFTTAP